MLLTGSRNNAGDFLIKHRAMALLAALRPDREIVDYDGWKPLTDEQLEVINGSSALLLTGGPSVRADMHPKVYPLRQRLEDIRVPIGSIGVGWGIAEGRWSDTRRLPFTAESRKLLARLAADGLRLSVRDYHTQNALRAVGTGNTVMTGCPALYALDQLGKELVQPEEVRRVTVSLGARFPHSPELERQTRELVRSAQQTFPAATVTAAFHHSLDQRFAQAYGRASPLFHGQKRMVDWLQAQGVGYIDLSGSAERLIEHYGSADLHLGYRVHAHIFMTSMRKPSLLLAEDGRGRALREVLGGHVYDAIDQLKYRNRWVRGAMSRLNRGRIAYEVPQAVASDAVALMAMDAAQGWPRAAMPVDAVERRWPIMKSFLASLP